MKIGWCVFLLALAAGAWAQQGPTISSQVNLVTLFATVQDPDGRVVQNLRPEDFHLQEDGIPQNISYFSREENLPLTVGLLVDTSRSQIEVLEQERSASYRFLDQVLRGDLDRAFVVSFDIRVETVEDLTSSRSALSSALTQLSIPPQFGTLIFSAVKECSENLMRPQAGRKAFILLTDGVAFREHTSITTAIEYTQRANTIIFPIRYSDPVAFYRPLAPLIEAVKEHGKQGLQRMARETGGISFEVSKDQSIEAIYSQIEDLLRNQYTIGFTPSRSEPDGKYHKLKLATRDPRFTVATRAGYYSE
jgi:VWFA-related protein